MNDTIVALSSGALPAAIAVLRISGPEAFAAAARLMRDVPPPRAARVRRLCDENGALLDEALVLAFDPPGTATGEPLVELHLHGAPAIAEAVQAALLRHPGVRSAEAGEFTRRALINGRIALTEAEGLADLLAAQTEAQRRAAMAMASGALHRNISMLQREVLDLSAAIEALIDFSDEDDVDAGDEAASVATVAGRAADMGRRCAALAAAPGVERLHDGFRVVLAGPPNAGKSTLLNALAGRQMAIVSDVAGTTRDRIEVPVRHAGLPFLLTDTAGLTDRTDDRIEAIGVSLAQTAIAECDVLLWLGDDAPPSTDGQIVALHPRADLRERASVPSGRLAVAAASGQGIDALWGAIVGAVASRLPPEDGWAMTARQRDAMREAAQALSSAATEHDPLLIAEALRAALRHFDRLTGAADTEAMLDSLFGRFCIGK
ncbi:tRNA uridine-5-carboxymethylaminomethyl(34) synthesis GTPase MnmE [Sphingomonas sp.]